MTEVTYRPTKGGDRKARLVTDLSDDECEIWIDGDPFPVTVRKHQVSCYDSENAVRMKRTTIRKDKVAMPKTKTSARELRQTAQGLGIKGWDEMSRKELEEAVAAAQADKPKRSARKTKKRGKRTAKTSAKKAPAKKRAAKKQTASKTTRAKKSAPKRKSRKGTQGGERIKVTMTEARKHVPFRDGSNMAFITPLLIKGGTRRALAEKVQSKIDLRPYRAEAEDIGLSDYDKRLILVAQTLRTEHGWREVREGRGMEGFIQVIPPELDK